MTHPTRQTERAELGWYSDWSMKRCHEHRSFRSSLVARNGLVFACAGSARPQDEALDPALVLPHDPSNVDECGRSAAGSQRLPCRWAARRVLVPANPSRRSFGNAATRRGPNHSTSQRPSVNRRLRSSEVGACIGNRFLPSALRRESEIAGQL
jgi:hypothetical protein